MYAVGWNHTYRFVTEAWRLTEQVMVRNNYWLPTGRRWKLRIEHILHVNIWLDQLINKTVEIGNIMIFFCYILGLNLPKLISIPNLTKWIYSRCSTVLAIFIDQSFWNCAHSKKVSMHWYCCALYTISKSLDITSPFLKSTLVAPMLTQMYISI